ncbi:MAG: right-handed parallel beta-helix repeat-containing protein [Actinobacteria bacterium]|nr:right-handed parallel beta-helix repeat-containing protein [Actinomycetota bacterium]MBU2686759.1 right-handed parallel beta-helix repeat-containing protein [Actinomycetota bacterium]
MKITKLSGTGFRYGATVRLTRSGQSYMEARYVRVVSSKKITCTLDLTGALPGAWNVVVINTDEGRGTLRNGFTVLPPLPTITSITPDNAGSGNPALSTAVIGTNFVSGAQVVLRRNGHDDIVANPGTFISSTRLDCVFDLTGADDWYYEVVVTNPDGGSATLQYGFYVNPAPDVRSIRPSSAGTGNPAFTAQIRGRHFEEGLVVKLTRTGCPDIVASSVEVRYGTTISCSLDLSTAELGAWDVHVINPDGGRSVLPAGFTVTSNPTLTSITPDNAGSGNPAFQALITGANFDPLAAFKLQRGSTNIQASTTSVDESRTYADCTFDLRGASVGPWDVVVTNPDGGTATLVRGFRVNQYPRVYAITPNSAPGGKASVPVAISGNLFFSGAQVSLEREGEPAIDAREEVVTPYYAITCTLDLTNALPGAWDVVVTNPDGGRGTLPAGFTVTPGPTVTSITPNSARTGEIVQITDLAGDLFQAGATVRLTHEELPGIDATEVDVVSPQEITCSIDLTGASPGAWNVVVTNPDGGSGSLGGGFTVDSLPPPTVTSIEPDWANSENGVVSVTVTGTGFVNGTSDEKTSFRLSRTGHTDIEAENETVLSTSEMTGTLDLSQAASGSWDVVVTNPDSQSGVLPNGFTVNPPPSPTSITPASAGSGAAEVRITIQGSHLDHTDTVVLVRGDLTITASNLSFSAEQITGTLDLRDAEPGPYELVVRDTYAGEGTLPNAFTVNPAPIVSGITPDKGRTGEVMEAAEVSGSSFAQGAIVRLTREGHADITAMEVIVVSHEHITCTLDLYEAEPGPWSVSVINPDAGMGTLTDGFTVTAVQTLTSIEVTPSDITLYNGSQQQFEAIGRDQDENPVTITPEWSCDAWVGTIDPQSGLFDATGWGTGTINATFEGVTGTAQVHIPSILPEVINDPDYRLEKKYSPYILTRPMTIDYGARLTIEPGVMIKAQSGIRNATIIVYGVLHADGAIRDAEGNITAVDPVTITSLKDDDPVYGDTNGDGPSQPRCGDWFIVYFYNPAEASTLSHCVMRYGGGSGTEEMNLVLDGSHLIENTVMSDYTRVGVEVRGGSPLIRDCLFHRLDEVSGALTQTAVSVLGGSPTVEDCTASGLAGTGLVAKGGTPVFRNNTIANCASGIVVAKEPGYGEPCPALTGNRIHACAGDTIYMSDCSWSALSANTWKRPGGEDPSDCNGINGIRVQGTYSSDMRWNNANPDLPFVLYDTGQPSGVTVTTGATLTIEPGTRIKAGAASSIWVWGRLQAPGTSDQHITMTSIFNLDGGSTYNLAPIQNPTPGDWKGIRLENTDPALASSLSFCDVSYAGGIPTTDGGAIGVRGDHQVTSCSISCCASDGVHVFSGSPLVRDLSTYQVKLLGGDPPPAPAMASVRVVDGSALVENSSGSTASMQDGDYGVWIEGGSPTIQNGLHINGMRAVGVQITGGTPAVQGNLIESCQYGIKIDGCDAMTTVAENTVNNCTEFLGRVENGLENLQIFDNSGSGCRINGIELSAYSWFATNSIRLMANLVPYTMTESDFTVPAGSTLVIDPGVIIKWLDVRMTVAGSLQCVGTQQDRICITSLYDDSVGGPTSNDGLPHYPSYNDWGGISLANDQCFVQWTRLAYGGSGNALLNVENCSPILSKLTIDGGTSYGDRGGTGIRLSGDTCTRIDDDEPGATTISYCDVAVLVDLDDHSRPGQPIVNGCNLWDSNYGVQLLNGDPENPFNAEWNDWCHFGVENGPAPAGDGSAVSDFETTDVLPWKGLGQNHEQDHDNDETQPEVGISYSVYDRPGAVDACEGLATVFALDGATIRQRRGNVAPSEPHYPLLLSGRERDLRDYYLNPGDPQTEGQDPLSSDNVDLVMNAGHGWLKQPPGSGDSIIDYQNGMGPNGGLLPSSSLGWGDQDLEWAIVYNCRLLARNDQADVAAEMPDRAGTPGVVPEDVQYNENDYYTLLDVESRFRYRTVAKGLHLLMGMGTKCWMTGAVGVETAQRITQPDPRNMTDAWKLANYHNQAQDRRDEAQVWEDRSIWDPYNLAVVYGASESFGDFFFGHGPQSSDPGLNSGRRLEYQVCDYVREDGGYVELPSSELPKGNIVVVTTNYNVQPGQEVEFIALSEGGPGETPQPFDSGVIVRFRKTEAEGTRQYIQQPATFIDEHRVRVVIPSNVERGKDYQVLFLNHNMNFGYLEVDLHIEEALPPP